MQSVYRKKAKKVLNMRTSWLMLTGTLVTVLTGGNFAPALPVQGQRMPSHERRE
jgi:hypothetical protein